MKPTKEDRKKFDLDLEYGQIREDNIADMFQNKKIEVKSERGMWMKTGNICIEYQSYGKPSGIAATEADYWFHCLCIENDIFCILVFEVPKLKQLIKKLDFKNSGFSTNPLSLNIICKIINYGVALFFNKN